VVVVGDGMQASRREASRARSASEVGERTRHPLRRELDHEGALAAEGFDVAAPGE